MVSIDTLRIGDEPGAWAEAGFAPDGAELAVGSVRLSLEGPGAGRGIVGWTLRGIDTLELDGLPTGRSEAEPAGGAPQPNGVVAVDHVVAFSPDLRRTTETLRRAGLDFRRLRQEPTPGGGGPQAFFRLGDVILEVVQVPPGTRIAGDPDGPARLWGISFLAADLDATVSALGDLAGEPRDAVQPGRRIATLRREAGLGPAIAFMS